MDVSTEPHEIYVTQNRQRVIKHMRQEAQNYKLSSLSYVSPSSLIWGNRTHFQREFKLRFCVFDDVI